MPRRTNSKTSVSPSRWIAYRTLADWRSGKGFVEDLLTDRWEELAPKPEDLRLSQTIVYGVLRNLLRLDFWIDRLAREGIRSLPAPMVEGLRIALYQLAYLDRVPDRAVVSEALALCEAVGLGRMKGVTNGILRTFPKRRAEFDTEIEVMSEGLSIETSHPKWLVEWAVERWGREKGKRWLMSNNAQPSVVLRPVASRLPNPEGTDPPMSAAEILIQKMGVGELAGRGAAVRLPPNSTLADLDAFREGFANVQDLSAQEAVDLLDPKEGETIFDLCSAPGGKTIQIADTTTDRSRIFSVDASAKRLAKVEENLARCGFRSVVTIERDLAEPWEDPPARADAVLLDAPCSGLGTLRRRVDLRYRVAPRDIEELADKAARLLENAAGLVRPGGRLVYSTCTLTREENAGNVERFLESHADWEPVEIKTHPDWLTEGPGEVPEEVPDRDGAFVALLTKRE